VEFCIYDLVSTIELHYTRRINARNGIGIKELEHQYAVQLKQWKKKAKRLAGLLRKAADIFDSGMCKGMEAARSLAVCAMGPSDVHEVAWCGSDNLRRWALSVDNSPTEEIFPAAHPPSGMVTIGMAGGALESEAALRAACVRYIWERVPTEVKMSYKMVAELCALAGHKVTSKYVRTIVMKGK
jgi:hypothetical protein